MPESWQAKADKAKALIEQIRQQKDNVTKAEDAQRLQAMFQDAMKMAEEAAQEHKDLEKARLGELLAEHERQNVQNEQTAQARQSFQVHRPQVSTLSERMHGDMAKVMASEKFVQTIPVLQQAALAEGSPSGGGYLVVPQYMQNLFAETRRQGNALRMYGWLNVHPVESNQIYLPRGSGAASVGIVSENTPKPNADQSFTQVSINIFTAAGISKQSKQMVQDSSPTVLDLSTRELGTLLGNLEEQKIINGSASGEPRGILNTTGLAQAPTTSDSSPGAVLAGGASPQQTIIDAILSAVVSVTTQFYSPPTGVLMHPRRLGHLLKAKDTAANYLFNLQGSFRRPDMGPAINSVTSQSTGVDNPPVSLFGLPIATSTNIPTNLNYGATGSSDQDIIIVAAWQEAHWFQRQEVTMDVSDTAGTAFETNQVWIRGEERFGFSAERYPTAFACVFGKGLAVTNT